MVTRNRATNLKELGAILGAMFDEEKRQEGLAIKLRPTDVVISPFGKSGTTWTQQIVHTLRTRGDTDFDDISRVVPWIETSPALGLDLDAEQKANPRAFKSHLSWDEMPRGGKYIIVIRDPGDALWSMFKFMEGWFVEPGSMSIDDFAPMHLKERHYFKHLMSWWPRRGDGDVLLMAFEHMKQDPEAAIRRIAAFIDVPLDDELLQITLNNCSIDFMLQHKDKFDDLLMRNRSEEIAGLPPGGDSAKVRKGAVGEHKKHLSPDLQAKIAQAWAEEIIPSTGYVDYAAMIQALAEEG